MVIRVGATNIDLNHMGQWQLTTPNVTAESMASSAHCAHTCAAFRPFVVSIHTKESEKITFTFSCSGVAGDHNRNHRRVDNEGW